MTTLGTIIGVWAHPDDDIYLSSGLMAQAAREGGRVLDVTATRGEGGSMDHDRWPPETMGEVRAAELAKSLEILGVAEHRFLDGHRDVDMDTPLSDEGLEQVVSIVKELRPDTILTFGPDGMTGHAAHKSVSRWATEAFHAAAPAGARLLYATNTPEWVAEWAPKLAPFEIFRPGTPPVTPLEELEVNFVLDDELRELKFRAISAHESQVEGLIHVFGREGIMSALGQESYRLAAVKEA